MKKAIVLGAAMLLASTAAFAASDIKFSGSAQAGYSFAFGEDNITKSWKDWDGDDGECEFDLAISDADGLWSLSLDDGKFGFGDLQVAAQINVNLTKAMNKAGIDTGDFGLSFGIGRKNWETELTAYGDKSGNHYQRVQTGNGGYLTVIDANYSSLVKARVMFSPIDDGTDAGDHTSFGVSAVVAPVDGVKVAVGYTKNGRMRVNSKRNNVTYNPAKDDKLVRDNWLTGSASVDVAKLVGTKDFKLSVDVADRYAFEQDDVKYNRLSVQVAGGVDLVDGYAEYSLATKDASDTTNVSQLKVGASFHVVEGLGLGAYTQFFDLTDELADSDAFTVGGDISYGFGNVTYALNLEYGNDKNDNADDHYFAITPSVAIVF
jgi:hypothetical protein